MSERDPLYIRSMDIFMEICRQMPEKIGLPNGTLKVLQSLCLITWFIRIFQQALQKYTQEYFLPVVTTFKSQRRPDFETEKKVNWKGEAKCNIFHLFAKF